LTDYFNFAPQWSSYFVPGLARGKAEGDKNSGPGSSTKKGNKKKPKEPLRVTNAGHVPTDSDMPALQSLSGTDNTDDDDDDDEFPLDEDEDDDDDESGYNTEEEDEIRELLREAMDTAHEADWLSGSNLPKEIDPFEDDRKGNPFLKLLGSLRGNLFVPSSYVFSLLTDRPHVFIESKIES